MFFLTNIVAAFYLVQQKKQKNSQMTQVYWKAFLVYLVNVPILDTT